MKEIWKKSFGEYFVSNLGNVKRNGKQLKKAIDTKGYYYVNLSINGNVKQYRVHRLVALAFIENKNNYNEINHINGIKTDNRVDNLEWCNHKQNMEHARKHNLISKEGAKKSIKAMVLSTIKSVVQYDGSLVVKEYESISCASKKTNIKSSHIVDVLKGRRKLAGGFFWKYK